MYEHDKPRGLPEIHKQALRDLRSNETMWRALTHQRDEVLVGPFTQLRTATDMNDVIFARGVIHGIEELFSNVQRLAKEAKE